MERDRHLLELLEKAGSISELARRLGVPRETLRDNVHKLRQEVEQENQEEGFVPVVGPQCVDLIISDTQMPFHHPDTFEFLDALKREYRPNRVFHVGDAIDYYGISFHEQDPDGPSITEEEARTRDAVGALAELFPEIYIALGNHDMRPRRKAAAAGIPPRYLRPMNELIGAPVGWQWRERWVIEFPNKTLATMVHNCGHKDILKGVQSYGTSMLQGHYATVAEVKYLSNREQLMFGMTLGCSIDKKAVAFNYNKLDIKRPILSHGVIINGRPHIIPMLVDKRGKWIGEI